MIWKPCELQAQKEQAIDALGNPTGGEWSTLMETYARHSPWNDAHTDADDREMTHNEQHFVLPVSFSRFPATATHAEIDGVRQKILEVIDLAPRYVAIRVEVYKK